MRTSACESGRENVTILYEDEALVVCCKPVGVLSAMDASQKRSMADLLAPRTVYPVHRLDRDVSGVMVFAKTAACAAFLSGHMEQFQKEYLAICEAAPPASEGQLCDLLFHDRSRNKTYVVGRKRGGVREARLAYRVKHVFSDGRALIEVRLFTGRTHQIRVQFASRGCPLCGDKKYGASSGGQLGLCAYRLRFPHPNGQTLSFALPDDLLPLEFEV